MESAKLLMRAYFEALYRRLEACRGLIVVDIDAVLGEVIAGLGEEDFAAEKFEAYRDVCLAFLEERIETYDPVGVQFLFDRPCSSDGLKLELQLNWYDSRAEFSELAELTVRLAYDDITDETLSNYAGVLIGEVGAFPDRSIIRCYEAEPSLQKVPDYVVSKVIERALGQ